MIPALVTVRLRGNAIWLAAIKLLSIFALLLLPLGMTHATIAVHHNDTSATGTQHCPEQGSKGKAKAKAELFGCAMVCSAVLPAGDIACDEPILIARAQVTPAVVRVLQGLHAEIATPPPRRT